MEKSVDKISIVVPVYNVEKYIENSLQSICNQTYREIEVLLIDDGSTDSSLEKCREWEKKDDRIKVITQVNAGAAAARNKGIDFATGKYIMFVDADDWIEENMLEVLYSEAELCDADVACCNLIEDVAQKKIHTITAEEKYQEKKKIFLNRIDSGLALLTVWGPVCKLYRREIIGDCRFEDFKVAEDLHFNTKIICKENFQKVVLVDYPFYHYLIYPGSAMKQAFQQKYLDAMHIEMQCYEMLNQISSRFSDINLVGCSVSRVFEKYAQLSKKDRKIHRKEFVYCKKFAKEHKKQLLETSNRHRRISGMLKVYFPNLYLQVLIRRYHKS